MKHREEFCKNRVKEGLLIQKNCGCIALGKYISKGPVKICQHYNFATVFPEYLKYWRDEKDARTFAPRSRELILFDCKLECGSSPKKLGIANFLSNGGCDSCTGRCAHTTIPFSRSVASSITLMEQWCNKNTIDPKDVFITSRSLKCLWVCVNGHEYNESPGNVRDGGIKCPICLSHELSPIEKAYRRSTW